MRTIAIKLKFFLEKMLFNDTDKITDIIGFNESELEEYHERQFINKDVKWLPGQPYWKGRKHTQKTKNKISESLKAKGWKGIKKIDTLDTEISSDRKKEDIDLAFREKYGTV